jgi:hypothetical protein
MLDIINLPYITRIDKDNTYTCSLCDYKCSRVFLIKQHLGTQKHKKNLAIKQATSSTCQKHECGNCGKIYKERTGLWRHKKKCFKINENPKICGLSTTTIDLLNENTNLKELVKVMMDKFSKDSGSNDNIAEQMKYQNEVLQSDMLKQIKEQNKIIQEMVPCIGNNNNNQLNISVFLNETCRDAINMSDFLKTLEIKLNDLKYTQMNGLTEGVSSVLVNGLKDLDTYKRPIHCTDMKREILYIKDNNEWEKEDGTNVLRYAINDVAEKQRKAIADWEREHPDWSKTDAGKDEYITLVKSVMTDITGEKNENKIIKNIAKETIIK